MVMRKATATALLVAMEHLRYPPGNRHVIMGFRKTAPNVLSLWFRLHSTDGLTMFRLSIRQKQTEPQGLVAVAEVSNLVTGMSASKMGLRVPTLMECGVHLASDARWARSGIATVANAKPTNKVKTITAFVFTTRSVKDLPTCRLLLVESGGQFRVCLGSFVPNLKLSFGAPF